MIGQPGQDTCGRAAKTGQPGHRRQDLLERTSCLLCPATILFPHTVINDLYLYLYLLFCTSRPVIVLLNFSFLPVQGDLPRENCSGYPVQDVLLVLLRNPCPGLLQPFSPGFSLPSSLSCLGDLSRNHCSCYPFPDSRVRTTVTGPLG